MLVFRPLQPLLVVAALLAASPTIAEETDASGRALRSASGERLNHAPAGTSAPTASRSWFREGARLIDGDPLNPLDPPLLQPGLPLIPHAVDPSLFQEDALIGSFTQQLGVAGIHAADFNADGLDEILVGHGSMWYVMNYVPAADGYEQLHFHETGIGGTFGGGGTTEVWPGDVDGDGAMDIVVLYSTGDLTIHDGWTGDLLYQVPTSLPNAAHMWVGPLEDGGVDEIVLLDGTGVHVFHPFGLNWSLPGVALGDVAAGQVDLDASYEIVTSDGSIIDVQTQSLEATYPLGFGAHLDVGDIDDDGVDEIVCAQQWGDVFAVDGDTLSRKWSFDNFNTSSIRAVDWDGDGVDEILIGDMQWGDVHVRDGGGGLIHSVRNPEHSVAYADVSDVDGDCDVEVIWGAGFSSTGADRLYVGDFEQALIEWENIETDGPMHCLGVGDVDGDGATEVIWASAESNAGYDGALVFVTDMHHAIQEHVPTAETNDGWMITQSMVLQQLDADPALEYVMNDSTTYSGKISAFDGITHEPDWTSDIFDGEYVSFLVSGDVEGDGGTDIIVGTGREHTGAEGQFIRQYTGDGTFVWRSPNLDGGWSGVRGIRVADVDADPAPEIVTFIAGQLFQFDGLTKVEEWIQPVGAATALHVADADFSGAVEILIGDDSGTLNGWDAVSRSVAYTHVVAEDRIHSMLLADVDQDGTDELVLSADNAAGAVVRVLSLPDFTLQWESTVMTSGAGTADSLKVVDADDDGKLEIVVSTAHSVRLFEYDDAPADLLAPVWDAGVGVQALDAIQSASCCPTVDLSWGVATDDGSPPVEYIVHRSEDPGFMPSAATVVAHVRSFSYRDPTVQADTGYTYIVHAIDAEGNEDDNLERLTWVTVDDSPPLAATIQDIVDEDTCVAAGVLITFDHPDPRPALRYDLYVDDVLVATDTTSPVIHVPGDALPHSYVVRSTWRHCDLWTPSAPMEATDEIETVLPPVLTDIYDPDDCGINGVILEFTHAGFPGAGHVELWVDGMLVEPDAMSPHAHVQGDGLSHDYVLRAVDDDCNIEASTVATPFADGESPLVPAVITAIDMVDPCPPGQAQLTLDHPGLPDGGRYELYRDGGLFLSPFFPGSSFPVGDEDSHDYVVRAVDVTCSLQEDSEPFAYAADLDTPVAPAGVAITDQDECAAGLAQLNFTHDGFVGLGHYELWRDGASFVSPVVDGTLFNPFDGLEHAYHVVAVNEDCGSSLGSELVDYRDKVVCGDILLNVANALNGDVALDYSAVNDGLSYNAYVGRISSLHAGYDHAKTFPGLSFLDSPSTGDGCDAADGPNLSFRVSGSDGHSLYFLVAGVDGVGDELGYGLNSDGVDRHDPSVDPRDASFFCP